MYIRTKFIMFSVFLSVTMCAMEDENRLITYDPKAMAQEATQRVWGAEHPILEKVLTGKIDEIQKQMSSDPCIQEPVGSTFRLRRVALQALQKGEGMSTEDVIAVRRLVTHELLLDGARNQDRIPWERAHSLLLGSAGITCAVIGYCVCKFMCDC